MSKRRRRLLILYVMTLLLAFELCLRLAVRHEGFLLRLYRDDNEAFWRLWFVQRARPDGSAVFYCHTYSPTRGWTLLPDLRGVHCMPTNPAAILNTNSLRLRGLQEFSPQPPRGKHRIAILGDSFTFGEEVSDSETYCSLIAQRDSNMELMNFGVRGYGFDQMLITLREEVLGYHPEVVMLAFTYLDVARVRLGLRDAPKPRFFLDGDKLMLGNTPVPRAEQIMAQEPYRLKILDLLSLLGGNLFGVEQREQQARALTTRLLEAIARETRAAGARPLFVYLPVLDELRDTRPQLSDKESFVADFCQRHRVECLQLRPAFVAAGQGWKSEGHWSAREHRVAAQALYRQLRSRGVAGEK